MQELHRQRDAGDQSGSCCFLTPLNVGVYEHKYVLENLMLVHDILEYDDFTATTRQAILRDCSEFIHESGGHPLFKTLPSTYDDFHRVKVRQHKRRNGVSDV